MKSKTLLYFLYIFLSGMEWHNVPGFKGEGLKKVILKLKHCNNYEMCEHQYQIQNTFVFFVYHVE